MKSCLIPGCEKNADARDMCQMHRWRIKYYGDPFYKKIKPLDCSVENCLRSYDKGGYCNAHYQRMRKTGSTDDPITILNSKRYRQVKRLGHPLANKKTGIVYLHRQVLFDRVNGGRLPCFWCAKPLSWFGLDGCEKIFVDHLNHDRHHNDSTNLVPSCNHCNVRRTRRLKIQPTSIYSPGRLEPNAF